MLVCMHLTPKSKKYFKTRIPYKLTKMRENWQKMFRRKYFSVSEKHSKKRLATQVVSSNNQFTDNNLFDLLVSSFSVYFRMISINFKIFLESKTSLLKWFVKLYLFIYSFIYLYVKQKRIDLSFCFFFA